MKGVDEAHVKERVKGRAEAEDVAMIINWSEETDVNFADAFLKKMKELGPKQATEVTTERSDVKLARLGQEVITFGIYSGKCLDDIPIDYLDHLLSKQEDSCKMLRTYLNHPELKSRRQDLSQATD